MQIEASRRGYAFAIVRPRGDRNFEAHTVSITFAIDEGPRTYIERINVRGNTRTRDYVIRREFDISEGDAYNRALVDRAERRLKNLDFFKTVKITTEPGSSSDRVILVVDLEEKSTGDFSVSGGYSTTDGALAEVSISERNFLGRGLFAKASVTYGQYARGVLAVVCRALSAGLPRRARPRPVLSRAACQQLYFVRHQDARLQSAARLQLCAKICRCSFAIRSTSSRSTLPSSSTIVTTTCRTRCSPSIRRRPISIQVWVGSLSGTGDRRFGHGLWCYSDGESSLPVRQELAERQDADLVGRLFAELQHARQQQEPDRRSAHRLQAGLRRRRRRRQLSEVRDRREVLHAAGRRHRRPDPRPGRHAQPGRQQRPSHARSVPDGPEPGSRLCAQRHRSARHQPLYRHAATRSAAPSIGARRPNCRCRSGSCRRKSG